MEKPIKKKIILKTKKKLSSYQYQVIVKKAPLVVLENLNSVKQTSAFTAFTLTSTIRWSRPATDWQL